MEISFQSIFYTINAPWIALMNQISELHFNLKQTNKNWRYISVNCHQLFLWERQGIYWLHVFFFFFFWMFKGSFLTKVHWIIILLLIFNYAKAVISVIIPKFYVWSPNSETADVRLLTPSFLCSKQMIFPVCHAVWKITQREGGRANSVSKLQQSTTDTIPPWVSQHVTLFNLCSTFHRLKKFRWRAR